MDGVRSLCKKRKNRMSKSSVYDKIKAYLNEENLDGILISRSDSFLGEYYPPYAQRLEIVTGGFSGSAGLALLTKIEDVLFVDSRYTIQAKTQTDFKVFEVPSETTPSAWIKEHMAGKKIAFNAWTHSVPWYLQMSKILAESKTELIPFDSFPDEEWFGEIDFKQTDVFNYDICYAGLSADQKKQIVAAILEDKKVDALVIMSPENVSWLLNKRARTVPEYPVVFERGILDKFDRYQPLTSETLQQLEGKRVAMDLTQTPVAFYEQIKEIAEIENIPDPINDLKAVKNEIEQRNISEACISESRTICRFLAWIENNKNHIDEMMCDSKLKEFRRQDPLYFADSFETIAAVGEHAARAHYRADAHSNLPITAAPLLLVDTGGHYLNGTTDMTRTIAVGKPTPLMKKRYTQVLQGHIDLAESSIKKGETTAEMDRKAHAWLRADGVDYYHGTSHGIGMMLAVHEMPPVVHERDTYGLRAGMVFSNEPAYYSEKNKFGIRLETMLMAIPQDKDTLVFENLLLIPFDYRLVDFSKLTTAQKAWLAAYHSCIEAIILPTLSEKEQKTLLPFVRAFQTES